MKSQTSLTPKRNEKTQAKETEILSTGEDEFEEERRCENNCKVNGVRWGRNVNLNERQRKSMWNRKS